MPSHLAGGFPCGKVVEAQPRGIGPIALIDLYQRKVAVLHLVRTAFHVRGVIRRVRRHRTSLPRANAELARGRLVIGVGKTPSDACAIHKVTDELHPGVLGRPDRREYARPIRESREQFVGVGFHAIERFRVLIEKREEHRRDGHKTGELPFLGPQARQYTKTENGRNGREAENQKPNPAPGQRRAKILWKKSSCTNCDEIELRWENQ